MTQPLVLTRLRQDVSAGKCVAGMFSSPRLHTSCCSKVISAPASIASLLHRARMPRILKHQCESWLWDVPKTQTFAAQPRTTAWAPAFFGFLDHHAESGLCSQSEACCRDLHRIARTCAGTGGRCIVTGQKPRSSKQFRVTLKVFIFT